VRETLEESARVNINISLLLRGNEGDDIPSFLGRAVLEQHQAILNRHDAVIDTVEQQQPTAGLIDDPRLHERELLLSAGDEFLDGLVPVLGCPGRG
jgi:hypothetical protein